MAAVAARPIRDYTITPLEQPSGKPGARSVVADSRGGEALGVEEQAGGLFALGLGFQVGGFHRREAAEEMVEVEFEGLERVEQVREQAVEIGFLLGAESEASAHEAGVFGEENGFVFLADAVDDGFGSLDELGGEVFRDALRNEGFVIGGRARADELSKGFTKPDEIPPDDGGLVSVAVPKAFIVMVGRVRGIEVVQERERAKI